MSEIKNRYDFAMLFDVKDGNPNGDPDAGNLPRVDPETGHGLVSDVCLKRKIRNYVLISKGATEGFDIFVKEKSVLNALIEAGYARIGINLESPTDDSGKKRADAGKAQGGEVDRGRREMCRTYFDVRSFGAVMSTGPNAGQVRGPVQLTFARSIDPIVTLEHAITRMAVATAAEAEKQGGDNRTMGRKNTVPYGLYLGHGFVSPAFARSTGFSDGDLSVLWDALIHMFEQDRSAARGLMAMRQVFVFRHASALGSAFAHRLFDRIRVARKDGSRPARAFEDYEVRVDKSGLPEGVELMELVR